MAGKQTAWERAKADSQTFRGIGPKAATALLGAAVAVSVQAALGWPEDNVTPVAVTVGSGLFAAATLWVGELIVNWWRAPLHMLGEDVQAIRERLEAQRVDPQHGGVVAPIPASPRPQNVRLFALDAVRRGEAMIVGGGVRQSRHDAWANEVVAFLTENATPMQAEQFVTAGKGINAQLDALRRIAEEYTHDT